MTSNLTKIKLTFLAAALCQTLSATPAWSVEVGQQLPNFGARTLSGEKVGRSTLAGKPALLIFWNTWCNTCKEELPLVNKLALKYSAQGLTVLAINTGLNDSMAKAEAYWKKREFQFPSAYDQGFDISASFGVNGVPTVLLVDARGVVRYKSAELPDNMDERVKQLSRQ